MAKLILVDNYNREHIADKLVEENILMSDAEKKANEYNNRNPHGDWFARAVSDDYKVWGGISELV